MTFFLVIGLSIIGVYLIFAAFLYFNQSRLVFMPTREIEMTPDELGLAFEDVYLDVAPGERIHAWYVPGPGDGPDERPTVLFCHGNGGNISHRLPTIDLLHRLGVNLLIFDYRGYGQSDGQPSEANVYDDAEAAWRHLVEDRKVKPERLYLFGRSLGGCVAVELAGRVECAGVILESTITSARDLGQGMYPFMPVRLLVRYKFDSISKIGQLTCPVLVAHSPDDEMVPYQMGLALFEKASEPKQFLPLTGGHNERLYFENEGYLNGLRQFMGLPSNL